MVRIAHIADVHLGAPCSYLGDKAGLRRKDFENTFERVIDICLNPENRINALVIAGDLFDTVNPPSALVGFVQKNISRLTEKGIPVILVPGTHDAYGYTQSVYKMYHFSGADILCSPTLTIVTKEISGKKVFFYGMAYTPGFSGNPFESFALIQEEGIHIGIIHGSLEQPSHWEKREQDLSISGDDVACSNLDYLALGHYHTFQQNQFGKTLAVYPGSLEGKTFSEQGERFMVIVDFAAKTPVLEKRAVNTRNITSVELSVDEYPCESQEDLINLIKSRVDPESVVELSIKGTSEFLIDNAFLEQVLSDTSFYIRVKDETTMAESSLVKSWERERTIRGMFTAKLLERIAKASAEEKPILEEALKIGITQFRKVSP